MQGWFILLAAGVVALVGGVLALLNPLAATIAAVVLTGWVFVAAGVIGIIGVFFAAGWGARLWTLLLGALMVALGAYILGNPVPTGLVLTWLAGALFLASGLVKVILSFGLRQTPFFWLMLMSGALSALLGFMVLSNFPGSAVVTLGTLLAIELLSTGIANVSLALRLRAA